MLSQNPQITHVITATPSSSIVVVRRKWEIWIIAAVGEFEVLGSVVLRVAWGGSSKQGRDQQVSIERQVPT